jgi:hypothetical protein
VLSDFRFRHPDVIEGQDEPGSRPAAGRRGDLSAAWPRRRGGAPNDGAALRDVQDAARHADPRTTRLYDRDARPEPPPVHRLLGLASS